MKTYIILNQYNQIVKTLRTKNLLEVEDEVFELEHACRYKMSYFYKEQSEAETRTPSALLNKWEDIQNDIREKTDYYNDQRRKHYAEDNVGEFQSVCRELNDLNQKAVLINTFVEDLKQLTTPGLHR